MRKLILLVSINVFITVMVLGQTKTILPDSLTINGGIDAYYSFNFNQPQNSNNPYFVNHHRHNEFNLNLAYLSFKYTNNNIRLSFIPAIGTYMQANYAPEPVAYQNLLDANVGVRLSKTKNIWIDAGVFASPITDEGYFSKDQLAFTRSLASEFTPYYLTGLKLTLPLTEKLTSYAYVVNGWQQIMDVNSEKSFVAELAYAINKNLNLDYNFYVGNQVNSAQPDYRMRYVNNLYFSGKISNKSDISVNTYLIIQQIKNSNGSPFFITAYNLKYRYHFNNKHSVTLRGEYFKDKNLIDATPLEIKHNFNITNFSGGYNLKIANNALFRFEVRRFLSENVVFVNNKVGSNNNTTATGGLTVWF